LVACPLVDDRVQLVFSWDPRAQTWVKEIGPEEAAQPPAAPLDDGAVQTYFLDPRTGRWMGTILGVRGRLIAEQIGKYYRMPAVTGLAVAQEAAPQPRFNVEQEKRRSSMPALVVLGVVLTLVAGAGAVASNTLFATASDPQAVSSNAPAASVVPAASPATDPSADASSAPASAAPTAPGATGPRTTPAPTAPARTPAPTPRPQPTTMILTTTTTASPAGLRLFYSGPSAAVQGTVITVTVNALDQNGEPYRFAIDVRVGNTGWSSMATHGDGKYTATLPLIAAKGDQMVSLNVHFGNIITPYAMGTMTIQ
jgi:hypothetical protein